MLTENGRGVAQSGSALQWGCRGRRFESSRPDQVKVTSENACHGIFRDALKLLVIPSLCLLLLMSACGSEKTAQQAFEAGDYAVAYKLFRTRAEAGDAQAQNYLGMHYYLGLGVQRDWQQALQWYDKAATQGDPRAQLNYGLMFQNGYGVSPDMVAAFTWYYAAYRQGSKTARYYLDALAADNLLSPIQIDYAKVQAEPYITNPVVTGQGS